MKESKKETQFNFARATKMEKNTTNIFRASTYLVNKIFDSTQLTKGPIGIHNIARCVLCWHSMLSVQYHPLCIVYNK